MITVCETTFPSFRQDRNVFGINGCAPKIISNNTKFPNLFCLKVEIIITEWIVKSGASRNLCKENIRKFCIRTWWFFVFSIHTNDDYILPIR